MPGAETADLAALLTELKNRSGLSYGVLAQRLHASASTLHRYCRGEALPPEFATVERFARLCRATPEEHAELHRRWIAADTARERERKGARPRPPVPPATPEPAEGPAPVAPAAGPPAAGPSVTGPSVTGPSAGEPAAVWPGAVRLAAAGDGPPPATRRAWPRIALAAAGVLAAVLTIALLTGLLTGGGGTQDGEGSDGGGAAAGAPEGATGTAPLAVATRPYALDQCEGRYLVDRPPSQVPPPPSETEAPGWARALGAVPAGEQLVELTVQGTGQETVVLRDLRLRVTESGEPLPWQLYGGYSACGGGPVRTAAFDVDLDAAAPRPAAADGQDDLPLWVDESEPLVFYVDAHTDSQDVSWYLELDWSSGEDSGTLRVDDEGRPFRTSAVSGQTEWGYLIGGTEWFDADTGRPADF
ncbi:helix-turn-helix domain-containing protein [Streptomyces hoynatensis]|uniref:helix-turn-helix domain-containing protein n=1 Tax=Streptomyces hoynatensis TaxID=1141874 RepID=UPI001F4DBDAE|nr:helix-turn-helix transcriptional regulator [Streptomyces hoynatensis]